MSSTAWPAPPLVTALREDGTVAPGMEVLPAELAVALYEQMVLSREADTYLVGLQRRGRIAQHASAEGEEATIVGAAAAMRDEDWIFPASRETAAALWRGMPLVALAHHAFGTPRAAGKGRDIHAAPFWKPARVVSASPLSGTQIPHAVGVAWAARSRGEDIVALVFFGDGATSSADFHAGMNLAGVTRAPVVAVCRNNGWATSMPSERQTASDGFAVKAVAYGIRSARVDGGDVVAVLGVVRDARARAAAGEGCTLVEAVTRPRAPGESDDSWAKRDPIGRMRVHLEARDLWDGERDGRLRGEVRGDVERAMAEAEREPAAAPQELVEDVYARMPWHLVEQRELLSRRAAGGG